MVKPGVWKGIDSVGYTAWKGMVVWTCGVYSRGHGAFEALEVVQEEMHTSCIGACTADWSGLDELNTMPDIHGMLQVRLPCS